MEDVRANMNRNII